MGQCCVERQNEQCYKENLYQYLTEEQKTQVELNTFVKTHKTESIYDYYNIPSASIGKGVTADVRQGVHKTLGVTRAIKIISTSRVTPQEIERNLEEIEILKMMDHPNILKIIEVFQSPKQIFIVTELYTGGELFDLIAEQQNFSERDAVRIIKQVLQGLNYCHQHKIVHRDIKPEHIFFENKDKQGVIKIIDFGTARVFEPHQKMNQKLGTPYYIAPEVLKRKYDEKCDIWSCGVITYILLCGYPPFNGQTDAKILEQVGQGKYDLFSEDWGKRTEEAKDFISKLMEIDPQKRLSASQALQHPWIKKQDDELNESAQLDKALGNMKTFKTTKQLQRAIYTYMVNQFSTVEEKSELIKTFKALDTNNDGQLSKEELLVGLKKIMGEKEAQEQIDGIMKESDTNNSGSIDYSEFIAATINRTNLLSQDNLQRTFKAIDQNGNGSITLDHLKFIFGNGQIKDEIWKQIMLEINEKEEMSFSDFSELMLQLGF